MTETVLALHDLRVTYRTLRGPVHAVRGVSLAVPPARIFGLVGESGSGKSTVAQAVMGALRGRARVEGEVRFRGAHLLSLPAGELRRLWGRRLAMVFQDPTHAQSRPEVVEPVSRGLLVDESNPDYPPARRRVRCRPRPAVVSSSRCHNGNGMEAPIAAGLGRLDGLNLFDPFWMDVTTEARILDLVESLRQRSRAAILYISHNLGVIHRLCRCVSLRARWWSRARRGRCSRGRAIPTRSPSSSACRGSTRRGQPGCCQRSRALSRTRGGDRPLPGRPAPQLRPIRLPASTASGWFVSALGHRLALLYADAVPPPAARLSGGECSTGPTRCYRARPLLDVDEPGPLLPGRRRGPQLRHPTFRALDGVSLAVEVGETLAVVGESGSVKTTLARAVIGLLRPTGGRIGLDGTPSPTRGLAARSPCRLQIVFQNPDLTLNPQRTILEAVARPLELFGLTDRRGRRRPRGAPAPGGRPGRAVPRRVPEPDQRRAASARGDRPRFCLPARPRRLRRADLGARRLGPGHGAEPPGQPPGARPSSYLFISHDLSVVRHIADRSLSCTSAACARSVAPRTSTRRPAIRTPRRSSSPCRPCQRPPTATPSARGTGARPGRPALRLPVPPALPPKAGADLRGRGPAAHPRRAGTCDRLPYPPGRTAALQTFGARSVPLLGARDLVIRGGTFVTAVARAPTATSRDRPPHPAVDVLGLARHAASST